MSDDPGSESVIYNGRRMPREEAEALERAQGRTHWFVHGKVLPRIPYGNERTWPPAPGVRVCPGCGAVRGQLHEPLCPVEQCPACAGSVMTCACGLLSGEAGGVEAGEGGG